MRRGSHRGRPVVRTNDAGALSFHASASFAYAPAQGSSAAAAVSFSSLDFSRRRGALKETLRDRDLRLTDGRLAVLAIFKADDEPIDAEEAWRRLLLADPDASHSSLYRHIAYFVRHGVLTEFAGRNRRRFALPAETRLQIVSAETSVQVDGADLSRAIRAAAIDAGLVIAGRRIVIHFKDDA